MGKGKKLPSGTQRQIKIKCKGSRLAPLMELESIQGPLKELSEDDYQKLRRRIETKGFDAPMFVWGKYILDGTQRDRVLTKMIEDGWELPQGLVPVCDIEAATLEEAKDRLLGYVSQYGHLTEDGLYEFLSGMGSPDLDTLDLPDFDLEEFRLGWLEDGAPQEANEPKREELKPYKRVHILLSFPPEIMAEIQDKLSEIIAHPQVEYEQGQN